MSVDPWARGTFEGTELAQARVIAGLSPDERVALLEELLVVAEASGALQRARREKQDRIDAAWSHNP